MSKAPSWSLQTHLGLSPLFTIYFCTFWILDRKRADLCNTAGSLETCHAINKLMNLEKEIYIIWLSLIYCRNLTASECIRNYRNLVKLVMSWTFVIICILYWSKIDHNLLCSNKKVNNKEGVTVEADTSLTGSWYWHAHVALPQISGDSFIEARALCIKLKGRIAAIRVYGKCILPTVTVLLLVDCHPALCEYILPLSPCYYL